MRSGDRGGHKTGPFCSTHWPAQGWSKKCFTSRIKWAGTPSCLVVPHSRVPLAQSKHSYTFSVSYTFDFEYFVNCECLRNLNKIPLKKALCFCTPPPPPTQVSRIYKLYFCYFNVYGSVHRNNILIYIQQNATLHSLFISGNCSTCFGWYFHPSSGAQTAVSTASGICQTVTATCRYSGSTTRNM
jgi:hypothetical protein